MIHPPYVCSMLLLLFIVLYTVKFSMIHETKLQVLWY